MSNLDTLIQDLVIANRILAKEDVVDAYGHVSVRNPDNPKHFFLSRSLAPELIEKGDIVEHGPDGMAADKNEKRSLYLERFIHAGIFEKYPDVQAVVHAHAEDILPFGIATGTPLKPVIHSGSFIGPNVPVWDIADKFGDTNLLVTNMDQGRDLAKVMDGNPVALMRDIDEIYEFFDGDPWPHGVEPNRPTLTALVQYLADQALIAEPVPVDDLFVPTYG